MSPRVNPASPLLSPSRPLAPIILRLNARRKRPIPPVLPWGRSLHNLTVGQFLEDYRAHLPFVVAQLRARGDGSGHVGTHEVVGAIIKIHFTDPQNTLEYHEALREKMAEARRLGIEAALKEAKEDQEKMEEGEEAANDPVAAVVDFLLSLIGL